MRPKRKPVEHDPKLTIRDVDRARERTMDRAVRLLAAKPRSVAELHDRLLEKSWTNREIVDAVIEKLAEYGYLNDRQYAADLALSKLQMRPQGKRRLKQSLSQKKLDRETIDEAIEAAFEKLPEEELIDQAIEKRIRLKGIPKTREETKRFYDHLLRRGFSYDLILTKLREIGRVGSDE
jgi:regulatory protein